MNRYIALSILSIIILYFNACVSDNTNDSIQKKKVTSSSPLQVQSLDAPENPYSSDYDDFDEWIHVHMVTERTRYTNKSEMPEGWVLISAQTTSDGYLIPFKQRLIMKYEGLKNPGNTEPSNSLARVYAEGILPDSISTIRRETLGEVKANYFNYVPDWVLNTEHSAYKLVPNGEIVAIDYSSNSSAASGNSLCGSCDADELWYRYSSTGELLGMSERGWWWLYFDAVNSDIPEGSFTSRADGYAYFENWETGEITSVWSWDGTELDKNGLPAQMESLLPFLMLSHEDLSLINEFQTNQPGS